MFDKEEDFLDIDLEKDIKCPKCNIKMQQILISKQDYTVTVDRCNRCDGYWFDRSELEKVLDEESKAWTLQFEKSFEDDADFRCPRCEGLVETRNLYDIKVDLCLNCGGIWLDRGELEAVQRTYRFEQNQARILNLIQRALES
jgi:Zn-finger nucleic acid-binding protein